MKDKYEYINKILIKNTIVKEDKIVNKSIKTNGLTFIKLRDVLFKLGKIHKEILEDNIYIAVINGGLLKKNKAYVVLQLYEKELIIASYADEGILNQHTSGGVIDEITRNIGQYIEE